MLMKLGLSSLAPLLHTFYDGFCIQQLPANITNDGKENITSYHGTFWIAILPGQI